MADLKRIGFTAGQKVFPLETTKGRLLILEGGAVDLVLNFEAEQLSVKCITTGRIFGEVRDLGLVMAGAWRRSLCRQVL